MGAYPFAEFTGVTNASYIYDNTNPVTGERAGVGETGLRTTLGTVQLVGTAFGVKGSVSSPRVTQSVRAFWLDESGGVRLRGGNGAPGEANLFGNHGWGNPDTIPCFPAEALVHTPDGLREIQSLREGDLVLTYDSKNGEVVPRPVTACLGNWTQHLVKIKVGNEVVWATRIHPFYLPETDEWRSAMQLKAGMKVLGIDLKPRMIEEVQIMGTHEDTFNISVAEFHTFFVGETGVLVHNSGFENMARTTTQIYAIRNAANEVVYVGKTIQGLDVRFQQHVNSAHPEWANGYRIGQLEAGNWTPYEAAVWEQHYMDTHGGKTVLQNKQLAISEAKYSQFKSLHNPC